MRVTSHGFSSVSAGSQYVKIYNSLDFRFNEGTVSQRAARSILFFIVKKRKECRGRNSERGRRILKYLNIPRALNIRECFKLHLSDII